MRGPHLTRALVLETRDRVPDGMGGFDETWRVLGTLWAEVTARQGGAAQDAGLTVSRVPVRIVVRAHPVGAASRPLAGQRFRDGVRLFPIRAVNEQDRGGRYLSCSCEEEVAP